MKWDFIARQKYYFDTGQSITNYAKYIIVGAGLVVKEVYSILYMAIIYAVISYILGKYMCNSGYKDAENEISNQFNPFQKQVRNKLRIKTFK